MGKTDQGEHPLIYDDYSIEQVDAQWLQERVKPKRHIGLTAELCIMCRACEDVCPWECIFMMSPDIIKQGKQDVMTLASQSAAVFIIDDNECTRCAICVERCPSDALWLGRTDNN